MKRSAFNYGKTNNRNKFDVVGLYYTPNTDETRVANLFKGQMKKYAAVVFHTELKHDSGIRVDENGFGIQKYNDGLVGYQQYQWCETTKGAEKVVELLKQTSNKDFVDIFYIENPNM